MKCKFCNADLNPEDLICPFCGKEQQEAAEETTEETVPAKETKLSAEEPVSEGGKPEFNVWKVIAIVACCALVVMLALVVWMGVRDGRPTQNTTTPTTTGAPAAVYDTYHGEPAQVEAAAGTVVAVIGEHQLTNRQLQLIYWSEFFSCVDNYGNYLTGMGLDYTQPLNAQGITDDESWEQYFVDLALNMWHKYVILGLEAKSKGIELDEQSRQLLEQFPTALEENAKEYGYASAQEMFAVDFGVGVTMDEFMWYMELQYLGQQYYDEIYAAQKPTREEISAYFDENVEDYLNYGITKESGKLLNVRHILIQPEGATVDSTTGYVTATDDQWAACLTQAQAILDGWAAGEATAESFGALAGKHSVDSGSGTNGGLYTDVRKGDMVEAFDAWLFDEARQVGDTGIVKTEFGYHIMYFVGGDEEWFLYAQSDLIQSRSQEILDGLMEDTPMETYKDKIVLDSAVLGVYKPENAKDTSSGS